MCWDEKTGIWRVLKDEYGGRYKSSIVGRSQT